MGSAVAMPDPKSSWPPSCSVEGEWQARCEFRAIPGSDPILVGQFFGPVGSLSEMVRTTVRNELQGGPRFMSNSAVRE